MTVEGHPMKIPDQVVDSRRPLGRALAKGAERNAGWHLDAATYLERVVRLLASPDGGAGERLEIALDVVSGHANWSKDPEKPAGELARELREQCARIVARLDKLPCVRRLDSLDDKGMLVLDGMLVVAIGETGKGGAYTATRMAKKARERGKAQPVEGWDLLTAPTDNDKHHPLYWWHLAKPRGPIALAKCLWDDVVLPRFELERLTPAALTRAVTSEVIDLYSLRYTPESRNGQQAMVFHENRGLVLVPSISGDAINALLKRGMSLLTSELGIDLLEWEVTEAHRQFLSREPDFRRLSIEGGWSALAHEKLGISSKTAAGQARAIVLAQAHLLFDSYGVRGNLLSYSEPRRATGGQRALINIVLGDVLLPGVTHTLREEYGKAGLSSREARQIVPILGKAALPGRGNDHGAGRRMVWRLSMYLREHAEELAREGAVRMTLAAFAELAGEAGAPRSSDFLTRTIDAWVAGDAKTPPLIVRQGEHVTLHESRRPALDFIIAAGKKTASSRTQGKASVRKRMRGFKTQDKR